MKTPLITKILLILIAIILVVGFFGYRSMQKDLEIEIEARQTITDDLKDEKRHIIDSVQISSLNEVKTLKLEINNLSNYSNSLIRKIKQYEKNPIYDIDFITAIDIITRSDYKGRNGDTIKRKDN